MKWKLFIKQEQLIDVREYFFSADGCFKAILKTITEYESDYTRDEHYLLSFIKKFLSTILVVPDNPDFGVLSLLRSLLNILRQYDWEKSGMALLSIYVCVLDLLSIMGQETLPYHVDKGWYLILFWVSCLVKSLANIFLWMSAQLT